MQTFFCSGLRLFHPRSLHTVRNGVDVAVGSGDGVGVGVGVGDGVGSGVRVGSGVGVMILASAGFFVPHLEQNFPDAAFPHLGHFHFSVSEKALTALSTRMIAKTVATTLFT